MRKILLVYPQVNLGGTEMVLLNIVENLSKDYEITFLAERRGTFEKDFINNNVKFNYISFKETDKLFNYFKKNKFDVIHTNTCSKMGEILKVAKKAGIPIRIAHSHNARTDLPKLLKPLKMIKSYKIEKYGNIFFACSLEAAKWLFPTKYKKALVIKNGINISKFKFDEKLRITTRNNLEFNNDNIVIGTVGRMSVEKNQIFLVKVLEELIKINNKYRLILIGDGPTYENIKKYINDIKLDKYILLLGAKTNINDYLCAMDYFALPSIAEGLGLSIVESQYNGLPSIASTGVPDFADISENLFYKAKLDINEWVEKFKYLENNVSRKKVIKSRKYDIKTIIKEVEDVYSGER